MRLRKHFAVTLLLIGISASAHAQASPPAVGAREVNLYARILAMTDTRQLDTALVDRALASTWRPMRAAAALAIGQVGAEPGMAGASRLRALLKDGDLTVAANAAYALGLLRDTASIADLGAALALNHDVAREAAWALGEIGIPARAAITTALRSSHDHDTAIQLLLAASKLRPVPLAEVRSYLKDAHPSVVWAASYAIARTRAPGGVRELIDLEASPAM
ncbi:MAG TPA: HEAT repeat domain-containing protein, partial [Gemmatimonadaceae bacterium]